jgi:phage FluMu gp28-like protein
MTITIRNGAVLRFKSAEKLDNLYGEDVWACMMDEASRMREEVLFAIRSTVTATKGPVRIIGNVKGRQNWFFKMCGESRADEPNMDYFKITAAEAVAAGVIEQAELDDAERVLPHHIFRELYFCEASDDGGNSFGLKFIRANIAPLSTRTAVANGVDLAKSVDWTVIHKLDENGITCEHYRF